MEVVEDAVEGGGVLDGVEGPCAGGDGVVEGGAVFGECLDEGVLRDVAAEAVAVAVRGGGHVEFEIPMGEGVVEGNCFPGGSGPEVAGAEHGDGGLGVVGGGFVGEPVGVGGAVAAVEFVAEEVGVFFLEEVEEACGEVGDEREVVVFVEEDVGVWAVLEPAGGGVEEFAVALFFALVVGGEVAGGVELDGVGVVDVGEVGRGAAVGEEDVVGLEAGGVPDGEGVVDGGWGAVVEEDEKWAGGGGVVDGLAAGGVEFVVGGEGEGLVPVGEAGLVEGEGEEGVVEAEEVDAAAPGDDEAAAEGAAGAVVADFGADEAEDGDGEIAEKAFGFLEDQESVRGGLIFGGVGRCWR